MVIRGISAFHRLLVLDFKVCFLVSDNGFSQRFCNCLNVDEIFLSTIKHLVCCKMRSKYFGNRWTNKKVLAKNDFK